jgi:hypothetical protein
MAGKEPKRSRKLVVGCPLKGLFEVPIAKAGLQNNSFKDTFLHPVFNTSEQ